MSEYVLCFPRDIVPSVNGVIDFEPHLWRSILDSSEFILRNEAEVSEEYKQLIPYIYIVNNGRILSYQRTPEGKEKRLHSLCSIGFGGHINPIDNTGETEDIVFRTAMREIEEELGLLIDRDRLSIAGFLNDDSNPVGFVHYGLVMRVVLYDVEVSRIDREDTISSLKFIDVEKGLEGCEYESWSVLLWEYLSEKGV